MDEARTSCSVKRMSVYRSCNRNIEVVVTTSAAADRWETTMCLFSQHLRPCHPSSEFLDAFVQSGSQQNTSERNKQNQDQCSQRRCSSPSETCSVREMHKVSDVRQQSHLAMVKVATQGDVTDELGTVHQICKEPAKRRSQVSQFMKLAFKNIICVQTYSIS